MNKIKLFPHQRECLEKTKEYNRVAYYLDMGLGKTFLGSKKMAELNAVVNLIVCQKSKIKDWIKHFEKFYPNFVIFNLTKKKEFENFFTNSQIKKVGVINYELTFRRPQLKNLKNFTLLLDESSLIQNENAKRSQFIMRMNPKNVILLSGTPTSGKYEQMWSQARMLGWRIRKSEYWDKFVEFRLFKIRGYTIKEVVRYKNVDFLLKKFREHGAVFMKSEEVLDLPEQIHNHITVSTTPEYKKFIKTGVVQLKNKELVGEHTLSKRLYARMLCGHLNKNKIEAFKDLMDSCDDRLIVFYNFKEELNILKKVAENKPISIINGDEKNLTNYNMYANSITFVQYRAGAMGLNLQKANKIIYFTLPESSELFEQSKKRIHRIGQKNTCFYYYLLCENSVEEHILENLKERRDYNDKLFEVYRNGC